MCMHWSHIGILAYAPFAAVPQNLYSPLSVPVQRSLLLLLLSGVRCARPGEIGRAHV